MSDPKGFSSEFALLNDYEQPVRTFLTGLSVFSFTFCATYVGQSLLKNKIPINKIFQLISSTSVSGAVTFQTLKSSPTIWDR